MKHKQLTQRQKTFRHCAFTLVLIFMIVFVFDYGFCPAQALSRAEKEFNLENTELIFDNGSASYRVSGDTLFYYLDAFSPFYGWHTNMAIRQECDDALPFSVLHCSGFPVDSFDGTGFFGRVNGKAISCLELLVPCTTPTYQQDYHRFTLDGFTSYRGERYFVFSAESLNHIECPVTLNAYGDQGQLVYTQSIDGCIHTNSGSECTVFCYELSRYHWR